ncbi:uncharacterized protein BX664DRAFT_317049 [Halteromyces radiatus]|uniref:uncharacterized protein n=1 Tax=Halteromyces radiatus TaxID=101107 RepID=UPI00221F14F6|nr:uncharacterized protein BX664DRAFT_317049 [Halteromyces radiatus]KAI8083052.1 hypothetical protein BX664DRAFT_317049 [Halteromyces radiatus]
MIIATSLDGSIRGIGRYDSQVYWTIRGGQQASLVKSNANHQSRLVQDSLPQSNSIFDNDNNDYYNKYDYQHTYDEKVYNNMAPLLEEKVTPDNEKAVRLWNNLPQNYNVSYIIEPVNGGILYLHIEGEPLQKLPFTMKDIVDRSFITEDGVVYIGEKSTLMIALDPIAGKILRKFDLQDSQYDVMMDSKTHFPPHTIYLARNEYKVRINDLKKNMHWRLTFSEYEPNAMKWNLPEDMTAPDIYIAPDSERGITAINLTSGDFIWTKNLPYPVVTVFDVYRNSDFSLVLSQQIPPTQLNKGTIGNITKTLDSHQLSSAYVSVHEGTLYALSVENFPLVQLAEWSFIYTGKIPGANLRLLDSGDAVVAPQSEYKADRLIGQNLVETTALPTPPLPDNDRKTIDGTPSDQGLHNTIDNSDTNSFYYTIGQHWKLYLILLLTTAYMNRKIGWQLYILHILPVWTKFMNRYRNNQRNGPNIVQKTERTEDFDTNRVTTTTTATTTIDEISATENLQHENNSTLSIPSSVAAVSTSTIKDTQTSQNDIDQHIHNSSSDKQNVSPSIKPRGLDLQAFQPTKSSVLSISDSVLGYGSHGTVVYKGTFDGRAVAVKRLLIDFYDVALQEVKLLQESDDHPNVIRYFYKEETDRFLYIALELCFGSLQDCMDRSLAISDMKLYDQVDPANILHQITNGIQHLHSLKIVHRDLKPQNILLAPAKHQVNKDSPSMRILISDFGLCKKLDGEQSSFHYTAASPAGTSGWRAPELLAGVLAASGSDNTNFSNSSSNGHSKDMDPNRIGRVKATRAIDIFSTGCIFYYVLSNGDHPFGNRFGRESNILKGDYDISKLETMGEDGIEAMDLIDAMISTNPRSRPTAAQVLAHPFFWSTSKRLAFLQDASDRFEVEQRDPPSLLLQSLEKDAKKIVGYDWYRRIDRVVANDLGKFRKYDGKRVRDLLRALRNKKHHWQDLPDAVKRTLGEPPDQFLYYFTARFPLLLLHTYHIILSHDHLTREGALRQYF